MHAGSGRDSSCAELVSKELSWHMQLLDIKSVAGRIIALISLGCLLLIDSGCGTVVMRVGMGDDLHGEVYPATQGDAAMIGGSLLQGGLFRNEPLAPLFALVSIADLPISLGLDTILLPVDLLSRHAYYIEKKARQEEAAEVARLVAMIRESPQVIFDKGWQLSEDPLIIQAVMASFANTNAHYEADMLERLYSESPRYRALVLAHPKSPLHLLTDNFETAYERAFHVSSEELEAIVSNAQTPIALVQKVADSQSLPFGAVRAARDELRRRKEKGL